MSPSKLLIVVMCFILACFTLIPACLTQFELHTYRLKTIAGSNNTNGIPASFSGLSGELFSLTWKDGELFLADSSLIKKIDKSGNIWTIGGSSRGYLTTSYTGDSIHANVALFSNYITSLVLDVSKEYLYVMDLGNVMIRRISLKNNLVSGVFNLEDNNARTLEILNDKELIYSSPMLRSIQKLDIRTSNNTYFYSLPRDGAQSKYVNETMYVLDLEMSDMYQVFLNGSYITLFHMEGLNPGFDIGTDGSIYFSAFNAIYKYNSSKLIERLAGDESSGFSGDGGPAVLSKITRPSAIALSNDGDLFFADQQNNRIRKIDKMGIITTIAGAPLVSDTPLSPKLSRFNRIEAFTYNSTGMYIYDAESYSNYYRVQCLSNGVVSPVLFEKMDGMVSDKNGILYYVINSANLVKKYDNHTVETIAGDGSSSNVQDGVNGLLSSVSSPTGISLYNNNLYISSLTRIRILFQNGTISTVFSGTENIRNLFVNADGLIFYIGETTDAIYMVTSPTTSTRIIGGGSDVAEYVNPATSARLQTPISLYVTKNLDVIIGEEARIRISTVNGNSISTLYYVEDGLESPPITSIDNARSIHVNESKLPLLEITFASKGNIFTLVREMNTTCFGIDSARTGVVCSGRGTCTRYNDCVCSEGYGGPNCELSLCSDIFSDDPRVCKGRGQCASVANCLCDVGYSGATCDVRNITCYGVSAGLPTTCSGHGICSDQDVCTCNNGFYGMDCLVTYCFGYASNSPHVCNNRKGQCVELDTCACTSGFQGSNCNITYCNDLSNTDPDVCNRQGTCIGPETCKCNTGYYGKFCEDHDCFGISSNNESVCSGRGDCDGFDLCNCLGEYSGKSCELAPCFGTPATSPQVCNNRNGTCTSLDACRCNSGWIGKECNLPFCFGSFSQQNFSCIAPIEDESKEIYIDTVANVKDLDGRHVNFTKFDGIYIKLSNSLSTFLNETTQIPLSEISIIASAYKIVTKEQVVSPVITLSLIGDNLELRITQLKEPIQIFFGNVSIPKQNTTLNLTCAYYDSSAQSWISEGLSTKTVDFSEELIGGIVHSVQQITCTTSHLTSFSVIDQNYKRINSDYKGKVEASQLRSDLISLTNDQIIIIATTLGGSCVILLTVTILVIVVVSLVMRARKKRTSSYSKSSCCCCCH